MRYASIALTAAMRVAGCGSPPYASPGTPPDPPPAPAVSASPGPAAAPHNAADIAFARALIPHHRAGIVLAAAAARNPEARTLAEAIIVTQQDEVVRLTGWLRTWGSAPPAPASAATPPAPASPGGDPVRALIAHQEQAVTIAQQEQANGINPAALDFAKQVIESRTAQTTQLTAFLR